MEMGKVRAIGISNFDVTDSIFNSLVETARIKPQIMQIECHPYAQRRHWQEMAKKNNMKRVKITVLRTTLNKDLADEYGIEGFTSCPMLKEGQVFYADYGKPDGFCDEAWKAIYQYVFALAHDSSFGTFL